MKLKTTLLGKTYEFRSIKEVLAKANEEKTGDQLAGLAAETAQERIAAKVVLSAVTLQELREHPAVPYEQDEVTRIIQDDVNTPAYEKLRNMTVAEFREWLLAETTSVILPILNLISLLEWYGVYLTSSVCEFCTPDASDSYRQCVDKLFVIYDCKPVAFLYAEEVYSPLIYILQLSSQ